MAEIKADVSQSVFENALSDLVRRAVRAEIQEIVSLIRHQDRLLTIDEVARQLSVSKHSVYRNGKKLNFRRSLGQKWCAFLRLAFRSG